MYGINRDGTGALKDMANKGKAAQYISTCMSDEPNAIDMFDWPITVVTPDGTVTMNSGMCLFSFILGVSHSLSSSPKQPKSKRISMKRHFKEKNTFFLTFTAKIISFFKVNFF